MGGSMPKNIVFCKSAENWRGHRLSISVVQIIAYETKTNQKLICNAPFSQEGKENDSITQIKRL